MPPSRNLKCCSTSSSRIDASEKPRGSSGTRARADGHAGPLCFTDDCAVDEFAELAGEAADGARVVRLTGGAQSFVDSAFDALTEPAETQPAETHPAGALTEPAGALTG